MRSVFVHIIDASRDAVCARLTEFAEPVGNEWQFPRGSAAPLLYIGFYQELELESEPQDIELLKASLGRLPDLSVCADISGRIPGDAEARQFVAFLLQHFRGVAWNDYTAHPWTLAEIESNFPVSGHRFFDYEGWYRELHGKG